MKKKIIIIIIIAIFAVFVTSFSFDTPMEKSNVVFHETLADPNLYINGIYTKTFTIPDGDYIFRFVPNGSSPEILSITLNGENFSFHEDFKLKGTSHQTGISEYFTWEYIGQKNISISEMQKISLIINPNGKVMGSVSVDILQN